MAYTIQPGDTLSQLALTHGTSVQELQKLNPQITDINKIYAGDALNLPVQAPIEQEPPILKVEEPESPIEPAQKILDTITPQTRLEQLEEERQSRLDELEKEKEVVKEERTSLVDKLKDYFVSREPTEDIIRKEMDAFGITKQLEQQRQTFQEITQLQQTATTLIEGRDAAITALGQMAVATPFISGQQARVAESYDRRISTVSALIGAKSAYAEAVAGNINQARAFIGDIVNAYTYDTQLELNRISMFLDLNREEISMLDTEYQNALNESQRYWENQLAEERAEREAVLNLSLSFLEAGISLDDSLEDALEKTKQWTMIQPDADVRSLMAQYPTAGIKESDSFTQAINKIAKMPREASAPITRTIDNTLYQYNPFTGQWEIAVKGDSSDTLYNDAREYIEQNIKEGYTSQSDMVDIFLELRNNGISISDAKMLMSSYGMTEYSGRWSYLPTWSPEEQIESKVSDSSKTNSSSSYHISDLFSPIFPIIRGTKEIYNRLTNNK